MAVVFGVAKLPFCVRKKNVRYVFEKQQLLANLGNTFPKNVHHFDIQLKKLNKLIHFNLQD